MVAEELLFPDHVDFYSLLKENVSPLSAGRFNLSDFGVTKDELTQRLCYNTLRWLYPENDDRREMACAIQNMHGALRDALTVLVKEHHYLFDQWFTSIPKTVGEDICKYVRLCEKRKSYPWFKDTVAYDFGKTEEGKLMVFDVNGGNVATFVERIMLNATVDYAAFRGMVDNLRENVVYGKKLYCIHDGVDVHHKAAILYAIVGMYAGVAVQVVNIYDLKEEDMDVVFADRNGIFVGCKWETFFSRVDKVPMDAVYWVQHPVLAVLEHKSFYAFLYMLLNFDMAREPLTDAWYNRHYSINQWLIPTYHSSVTPANKDMPRIRKAVQGTNADTLVQKDNLLTGLLGLVNNNNTVQQDFVDLQNYYPEYRVWLGNELLMPFASQWELYDGMPFRKFSIT